jgi:hypothetical protein
MMKASSLALAALAPFAVLAGAGCAGQVEPGSSSTAAQTSGGDDASDSSDGGATPAADGPCNGAWRTCVTTTGEDGVAACGEDGATGACGLVSSNGCHPGDLSPDGCGPCMLYPGTGSIWQFPGCGTPLVLSFDDEPVRFTKAGGAFDLAGLEASVDNDWVGAETPWLALDRNGNGLIDDGRELFGSMTELPDGRRAPNGFAALAALDDDGDGRITARDAAFARLLVWRDANQDRRSDPGELSSAEAAGLVSIDLDYRVARRCDRSGEDCEVERARFVFRDRRGERSGAVVDVHLRER